MNKVREQNSHDTDINRILFLLLRSGVVLSEILVTFGFLLLLLFPVTAPTRNPTFDTVIPFIFTYPQLGFIIIGLFVLMITPIARIASSTVIFSIDKDWSYTIICLAVLLIVLVSLFLGI